MYEVDQHRFTPNTQGARKSKRTMTLFDKLLKNARASVKFMFGVAAKHPCTRVLK